MAGRIEPGETGTVRQGDTDSQLSMWRIDFDDRTPKDGYIWGVFGPFLSDEFEVIP
jgi:hypothetical protein